MTYPLALILLVPWAVVLVRVLRARAEPTAVPFLALWASRSPVDSVAAGRRRLPPAGMMAALLAALLGILAATGIRIPTGAGRLVVVVDRGESLSRPTAAGVPRFAAAVEDLSRAFPDARFVYHPPAGTTPTAARDEAGLRAAVVAATERAEGADVVAVIAEPAAWPGGVVAVEPPAGAEAGVDVVGMGWSAAQRRAMVLLGPGAERAVEVTLRWHGDEGAGEMRARAVPGPGRETAVIFDLGSTEPRALFARVEGRGASEAGASAGLTIAGAWPRLEAEADLCVEAVRATGAYRRARPGSASGRLVRITPRPDVTEAAVIVAPAQPIQPLRLDGPATSKGATVPTRAESPGGAEVRVVPHAITAVADLGDYAKSAAVVAAMPARFRPIILRGSGVVLGVCDSPRQVIFAVPGESGGQRVEFALVFAAAVDWVADSPGGVGEGLSPRVLPAGFVAVDATVRAEPTGLWPGLYRNGAGEWVAIRTGPRKTAAAEAAGNGAGAERMLRDALSARRASTDATWGLLVAAVVVLLAAAGMFWRGGAGR